MIRGWAIYDCEGTLHMAPCDEKGEILKPHTLEDDCPCDPDTEGEIVMHWQEN